MRAIIARESTVSPTGMSYFTGSFEVMASSDAFCLRPGLGWFVADAFVFPDEAPAIDVAALLSAYGVAPASFVVLPHLGGAA
ncbi:hypothetical protein OSH11_21515 [Kaistia dalseonensis]|uniref:Uncharacterized protein n=1 Tax=Kaistia dalseonensis TaxID=410840 RepID=A0ABU0HC90_9HYPH|nr:hypothetical protein [Kaistia dalseonensis]MCX5497290.1 hypothetical protein [Kaistia dalseonensis]MDQ0439927.1 hypothetical protein [Kaistia dalseonensis]